MPTRISTGMSTRAGGEHSNAKARSTVAKATTPSSSSADSGSISSISSINPRVASVKPSKTMALADLASSLKADGVDVISLAAGEPDFDTPRPIVEAGIEALERGITRYTPNAGVPALKKKICEKLERENGVTYAPEEIVLSNGAKQSVWQGVLACCQTGDEVVRIVDWLVVIGGGSGGGDWWWLVVVGGGWEELWGASPGSSVVLLPVPRARIKGESRENQERGRIVVATSRSPQIYHQIMMIRSSRRRSG